ncbi:MAG: HupE/UreJ family protein [Lutibacter sp.]|uniref:HupE/UreJ family protein n=1 Tax=Lutibacter sp. TaxID=1925666 RepID=UPI00184D00D8|nr:HupE/UreJ family protein [Lutibacter sp.]MBT8317901.1 HupE/UreJ family protein [Lutibacter sp.]NNJ58759.1 HupE/UreJ family protein [Lutibacter sp.]
MDNFIFFVKQGLFHVLDWNAYDHILFLIALAVIYDFKNWKKVLWLISLFTVGHTLTLILAAYKIVQINSNLIEFLIPVTIIITALVNILYAKGTTKNAKTNINLFFALFFGLIHGLGFSGYFKMLIGSSNNKFIPLLEFALGIEIAQIVIVFIVLLLGFIFQTIFRFSRRDWILIISSIVIGIVLPILKAAIFW